MRSHHVSDDDLAVKAPLTSHGVHTIDADDSSTAVAIPELGPGHGEEEEEGHSRAAWDSKIQYVFMVISYAVGLGNVWRFPYLTQLHGGGAFMIPYFVMLFVEGMPILFLELAVGQLLRQGSVGVWSSVHPYLGGIGMASVMTSFLVGIYYNAIIMWCFFYLAQSFQSPLPWAECPMEEISPNITVPVTECDVGGATSYFWYREALDISSGIEESGSLKWKMLLCHITSWLVIYLCVCKGIKSSGKVVYFTATFPYFVLLIFFVRGITLEGAVDGLLHMFTPKMDQILDINCWLDAAGQIFFSFGLGFGGLIAFSSYNPRRNNVQKDTIFVAITNWLTAIFSCTVVFAVIGFRATVLYKHCVDRNIEAIGSVCESPMYQNKVCLGFNGSGTITREIYKEKFEHNLTEFQNITNITLKQCSLEEDLNKGVEGTGLAFIIFTQAINEFGPSAPFWSIVFFLMLLSLGLGSEFGTIEGVTTCLYDLEFSPIFKKKWLVSAILCTFMASIGILFVFGSGSYWVGLFDSYAGTFPLILVALAECISIGWVYGPQRFIDDLENMIGKRPYGVWKYIWKFVAPVVIISLLLGTIATKFSKPITYGVYNPVTTLMEQKPYPWFGSMIAPLLVLSSILWFPAIAIFKKCGIIKQDRAKVIAASVFRTTSSTTKFISSQQIARSSEDRDSGHNSDEEVPAKAEKPTTVYFEDIFPLVRGASGKQSESKL